MSKQIVVVKQSTKSFKSILKIDGTQITDLTDWACHIQLRNKTTRVIAGSVDREVTTKNIAADAFVITLTEVETNIDKGDYVLGVEFRNISTSQKLEDPDNIVYIEVKEGWVYD
tara:strand:- start:1400 stop:1741 length:342 start_codon:yes stop_codon:yes gene_type:complete